MAAVLAATGPAAAAPQQRDIERMNTYATLLGRGLGCGLDIGKGSKEVTAWLDRTFPPGSPEQKTHLPAFATVMRQQAELQANSRTAEACAKVRQAMRSMGW